MEQLELWGGVECTVNRVGDHYFDQTRRSGHHDRPADLDRFAALGISALRYPVLWERVAPEGPPTADWSWSDDRLARVRALGLHPIVGLLHHGSGPRSTDLLDPLFPARFAEFARAVARRYPWVEDYTPVNEPLTTARFSALYGHWHPHRCDDASFATALLNQVRATVLAMKAIREINPRARLVQTEDSGHTFHTAAMASQAEFENHRRWLTFDLLVGRVTSTHPLWPWLCTVLGRQTDLEWLADHPCPPDIVGLNYYLTSDRFLDERVHLYPAWTHGGNGRERYADVEVVRAHPSGILGHHSVLGGAWSRYHLPVAVTEVHAGCSREEQLRWMMEAWDGALAARRDGADVRAVTLWALLGSFDWNSLMTRTDGAYEPGAFDVRSDPPRATALATLASRLAQGKVVDTLAREDGWWRRPGRITCGPTTSVGAQSRPMRADESSRAGSRLLSGRRLGTTRPLVITGARGTLGSAVTEAARARGLAVVALSRQDLDVTDPLMVDRALDGLRPWAVVNAAGYVRVDEAEADPAACLKLNAEAATVQAQACAARDVRFVAFSSDLVFDGSLRRPYVESDQPRPLSVYGISKAEAEARVLAACAGALVIRTSAFFGHTEDYNFLTVALRQLASGLTVRAADDCIVSPTYVPDLVDATLDILLDGETGIWHLANQGQITWSELAATAATKLGLDSSLIISVPTYQVVGPATRPPYSALSSYRGALLPSLEHALDRFVRLAPHLRATQRAIASTGPTW
jgi:dTDP-4-dehydrorhamnose reductase